MAEKVVSKVVLIGDGRVGKTSIRRRYMGHGFHTSHLMTIGADFAQKEVQLHPTETRETALLMSMQIWDIAGQDNFTRIRARFMNNADGILLVFDLTVEDSFRSLPKWLEEVWRINKTIKIPIVVIGNKLDLVDDIKVKDQQVEDYLERIQQKYPDIPKIHYIKTSALTGENIDHGFKLISEEIYKVRYQ